jgi:hypothetical protein
MAAIARMLGRKFPSTDLYLEVEVLKQIAMFSGAGLLVSLVFDELRVGPESWVFLTAEFR